MVDVNEKSRNKFMLTALYEAIRQNKLKMVKLLIQNGANIAQAMYSHNIGIFDNFIYARNQSGSAEIVNILLTYGAEITQPISNYKIKFHP